MAKKKEAAVQAPLDPKDSKLPLADCANCPLNKHPLVPPYGDGKGYVLFVGEAPGEQEVKKGRPFVGPAGKLLHEVLSGLGLDLERVYYTNSVMCRPPNNRDPSIKEIECCHNRLFKEISDIKPFMIMPLGKWGHLAVTGRKEAIGNARGKPEYTSIDGAEYLTMSTLHPSGLLYNPDGYPDFEFDLDRALDFYNGGEITIQPPVDKYVIIEYDGKSESPKMEALLKRLETVDEMAVDLETTSLRYMNEKILTCAISWKGETAVSFDWDILRNNKGYKKRFADAVARIRCSFQNGQFDIPWFRDEGMSPNHDSDTMLDHYILDERKGSHSLERQAINRYKAPSYKFSLEQISHAETAIPRRDLLTYDAIDADYTRRLTIDNQKEMDDKDKWVRDNLVMPAAKHFTEFFIEGMLVDQDHLEMNGKKWKEEIIEIEEELRSFPGAEDLNFNSPAQLAPYLYDEDKLGLRQMKAGEEGYILQSTLLEEIQDIEDAEAQDYWRTQGSHSFKEMSPRSTGIYMLYWLAQQHDFPRILVRHRLMSKRYGTYYKGLKEAMWPDGRMRPQFKLHGTVTGRQSSSDPNIHGTPRLGDIKSTYIADDGFYILYGDLSQAEIKMMAHFSGDESLMKTLEESDIHRATLRKLFGLTESQVDALSEEDYEVRRRAAKTIRFGIQYGRAAKSLSVQLGVSVEEAQLYLDQIFREEPDVKRWIINQKHHVEIHREVESIYHRKRRFHLIANKRQRAEVGRQAVNMPIQSSVSDMTLMWYLKSFRKMQEAGIRVKRWPQIHDAIMIQVEKSAIVEAAHILEDTIQNDLDFESRVPFSADIKYGISWGNLHSIDTLPV